MWVSQSMGQLISTIVGIETLMVDHIIFDWVILARGICNKIQDYQVELLQRARKFHSTKISLCLDFVLCLLPSLVWADCVRRRGDRITIGMSRIFRCISIPFLNQMPILCKKSWIYETSKISKILWISVQWNTTRWQFAFVHFCSAWSRAVKLSECKILSVEMKTLPPSSRIRQCPYLSL